MENKTVLLAILLFSILIEGTVEYIKLSFQKKMCGEIVGAFVFALIISIAYKLDFFHAWLNLDPIVPYLGNVLTALIIARGSNYMFDLIGKFTEAEEAIDKITRPVTDVNPDEVVHEKDEAELVEDFEEQIYG